MAGCGDDDAGDAAEGSDTSDGPVAYEDHWHAAFGVYVCDDFLPATPEFESPDGIHTHGDDVIHIHPFTRDAAGENATLGVFLDGAGIEASDGTLTAGGETYRRGDDTCGDEESEVVVVRWADVGAADSDAERVDTSARFRQDGEGYVVAFVPEGADIPKPASASDLEALGRADAATGDASTTSSVPPEAAGDEETSAGAGDNRDLVDGFYEVEAVEPSPCRDPGLIADPASQSCYLLPDEPAAGTEIVDAAEASVSPAPGGAWQVAVTLTADGLSAFNEVAARCYQRDASCPLGQLALVVDGEIVFAPTIQEPAFERDQISVSGDFTEDEARSIADALAGA